MDNFQLRKMNLYAVKIIGIKINSKYSIIKSAEENYYLEASNETSTKLWPENTIFVTSKIIWDMNIRH